MTTRTDPLFPNRQDADSIAATLVGFVLSLVAAFMFTSLLLNWPTTDTLGSTAYPPCAAEDSTVCHWDASTRGNGEGRSFLAHADGTVTYLD